jgi:hypothetical protein
MVTFIERLENQYKGMQIPFELCPEWGGKITCVVGVMVQDLAVIQMYLKEPVMRL